MLKILPIMLLSTAQKGYLSIMLNIIPTTNVIMPQFIYNFTILNDYISIVRLQAVVRYMCYVAVFFIFDILCS